MVNAPDGCSAGRGETWRRSAGLLTASPGLALSITSTAGGAAAARPPGTALLRNLASSPVPAAHADAHPPSAPQVATSAEQRLLDLATPSAARRVWDS